jgi:hypothetical protein
MFDALRADHRLAAADDGGLALSDAGHAWLRGLGLEPAPASRRRRFAYPCLDWSERRDHLAGQLADELYRHLVARGWLRRDSGRAVSLTKSGERELLPRLVEQAGRTREGVAAARRDAGAGAP